MMQNDYPEIGVEAADREFSKLLPYYGLSENLGNTIRRFFIERTNLLREPLNGRIDFPHRTFQEYLAAQAAVNADDFGFLLSKSLNDQWRETLIMAASLARPK